MVVVEGIELVFDLCGKLLRKFKEKKIILVVIEDKFMDIVFLKGGF